MKACDTRALPRCVGLGAPCPAGAKLERQPGVAQIKNATACRGCSRRYMCCSSGVRIPGRWATVGEQVDRGSVRYRHDSAADEDGTAAYADGSDPAPAALVGIRPSMRLGRLIFLSLRDLPFEGAVQLRAGAGQIASQHRSRRPGCGVLGYARSGREHAHAHVRGRGALRRHLPSPTTVTAERAHQVDVVRPRTREHVPPARHVEDGAAKGGDRAHGDDVKRKAAGHHGGSEGAGMIAAEVVRLQADHRGQSLRRVQRLAPLRQHRRGELREHRTAAPVLDRCGHHADLFLEHQIGVSVPRPAYAGPAPHGSRACQIDRGPHGRMPRERHLHLGREDAHPRGPLRRLGRSQKHRFGQVHLARHLLHQLRRQMRRVREDAERVAAEGLLREDVEGSEVEFHVEALIHPCSRGRLPEDGEPHYLTRPMSSP